jgi:hypothetical protein
MDRIITRRNALRVAAPTSAMMGWVKILGRTDRSSHVLPFDFLYTGAQLTDGDD